MSCVMSLRIGALSYRKECLEEAQIGGAPFRDSSVLLAIQEPLMQDQICRHQSHVIVIMHKTPSYSIFFEFDTYDMFRFVQSNGFATACVSVHQQMYLPKVHR